MSVFHCATCDNLRDADHEDHCEQAPDGQGVICGSCVDEADLPPRGLSPSASGVREPAGSDAFYRGFRIDYAPPPIPVRSCDWQFVHEDYDGPEDNRCGHAPSLEAAKAEIDFWHEENIL